MKKNNYIAVYYEDTTFGKAIGRINLYCNKVLLCSKTLNPNQTKQELEVIVELLVQNIESKDRGG